MDEFEPYAAPATDPAEPPKAPPNEASDEAESKGEADPAEDRAKSIARAIKRLNKHLANPEMVAGDRTSRGGRLRKSTLAVMGVASTMALGCYVLTEMRQDSSRDKFLVVAILITVLICAAALAAFLSDMFTAPSRENTTPLKAMDEFLKSLRTTRFGHAWSMLSPTARKEEVTTPTLGNLPVSTIKTTLRNAAELEKYIASFWRSPGGNYLFRSKSYLVEEKGDVAIVKVEAVFRRERLWLILGVGAVVAYFSIEMAPWCALLAMFLGGNSHRVDYLKTLIRGSNGFWYMYAGDFFESVNVEAKPARIQPMFPNESK